MKALKPLSSKDQGISIVDHSKQIDEEASKENQVKYFMQKGLQNISTDCLRIDNDRTYLCEPNDFMKIVMNRIQIPNIAGLETNGDPSPLVAKYMQKFQNENGKVDYKGVIEDLSSFNYLKAQYNEPEVPRSNRSGMTDAVDYVPPRSIFDDHYIVLDQKRVPQNMIEKIENRTIRTNRRLKK